MLRIVNTFVIPPGLTIYIIKGVVTFFWNNLCKYNFLLVIRFKVDLLSLDYFSNHYKQQIGNQISEKKLLEV